MAVWPKHWNTELNSQEMRVYRSIKGASYCVTITENTKKLLYTCFTHSYRESTSPRGTPSKSIICRIVLGGNDKDKNQRVCNTFAGNTNDCSVISTYYLKSFLITCLTCTWIHIRCQFTATKPLRDIARTSPKGCSSRIWTFYRGPPSEPRERTSNFVISQGPPPELRGCLRSLPPPPPLAIHLDRCVIRWNGKSGGGGGIAETITFVHYTKIGGYL